MLNQRYKLINSNWHSCYQFENGQAEGDDRQQMHEINVECAEQHKLVWRVGIEETAIRRTAHCAGYS